MVFTDNFSGERMKTQIKTPYSLITL